MTGQKCAARVGIGAGRALNPHSTCGGNPMNGGIARIHMRNPINRGILKKKSEKKSFQKIFQKKLLQVPGKCRGIVLDNNVVEKDSTFRNIMKYLSLGFCQIIIHVLFFAYPRISLCN